MESAEASAGFAFGVAAVVAVGAMIEFGATAGVGVAGEVDAVSPAMRLFSNAFNSSISACRAASCFATAGEISGSDASGVDAFFDVESLASALLLEVSLELESPEAEARRSAVCAMQFAPANAKVKIRMIAINKPAHFRAWRFKVVMDFSPTAIKMNFISRANKIVRSQFHTRLPESRLLQFQQQSHKEGIKNLGGVYKDVTIGKRSGSFYSDRWAEARGRTFWLRRKKFFGS